MLNDVITFLVLSFDSCSRCRHHIFEKRRTGVVKFLEQKSSQQGSTESKRRTTKSKTWDSDLFVHFFFFFFCLFFFTLFDQKVCEALC